MGQQCQSGDGRSVVIVVDDDVAVRESLKFSLEVEGFSVRVFRRGTDLLREPDLPRCACLIIDQNMPEITGLDVVARLRDRRVALPTILITSHPSPAVSRQAQSAGIPIVEKPFLNDGLIDSIHAVMAKMRVAEG
jgi:FixJ family two-component response regulator